MKRLQALVVMALATTSFLVPGTQFTTKAQEATPQPVAADLSTFSTTLVGLLPGIALPSNADILTFRAEFAPGVVVPFASGPDAADTLIIVEKGELTVSVSNQPLSISRESVLHQALATPTASGDLFQLSSIVAPGEQGTVAVGDMTLIAATADGEMRNATNEPVTALMILMGPSTAAEATPAP